MRQARADAGLAPLAPSSQEPAQPARLTRLTRDPQTWKGRGAWNLISSCEKMKSSFLNALKAEKRKKKVYDRASKGLRMILSGTGQLPLAALRCVI